jgi:hypothetical protein
MKLAIASLAIALATLATQAQANRTVCEPDYWNPSRMICKTDGSYDTPSTRTVCEPDYWNPSRIICK